MARVIQKIYSRSTEKTMESMLEVCQNTLQELGMSVTTQFLDKSLIECIGHPPVGSPLGRQNTVTVYKEGDKIYIKLKYEMVNPDQFWDLFEVYLQIHGASTEEIEKKAKAITRICKTIREMGGSVDEEEVWDFLYNYEKNFNTLPTDEDEINAIAADYIKWMDEINTQNSNNQFQNQSMNQSGSFQPNNPNPLNNNPSQFNQMQMSPDYPQNYDTLEELDPEILNTRSNELLLEINNLPTIDQETKRFYASIFNQLLLPDQERLVNKIKTIEMDLSKVPYLLDSERTQIRQAVYDLSKDKRRQKLSQIIKDRQKKEAFYMTRFMDQQIKGNLINLAFLSKSDVDDIMNVILTMPFEQKQRIVNSVTQIEHDMNELSQRNVKLTDIERKNLRLDLIRLSPQERIKELNRLVEERNIKRVKKILFREIPQLEFEENERILKELMWLSSQDLRNRIEQIKQEMLKKTSERAKIFEKSSAGTACQKCGWPMGKFSKKCPRCGWSPDDWFKL